MRRSATAQFGNETAHVRSAKRRGPDDHGVGTVLPRETPRFDIDSAIDLDPKSEAEAGARLRGGPHFGQRFRYEGLAAESRHNRHDEKQIDLIQKRKDSVECCRWIEREAAMRAAV